MSINPDTVTAVSLMQLASRAVFRDFNNYDYQGFAGANPGSQICDDVPGAPDVVIIVSPPLPTERETLVEFHGEYNDERWGFSMSLERVI